MTFHYFFNITGNNILCLRLWGKSAAAPVHALHFGFGIGALIAPQLARPFISHHQNPMTSNSSASNSSNITNEEYEGLRSNVIIPYTISALLTAFFFLAFVVFYIFDRHLESRSGEQKKIDLSHDAKIPTKKSQTYSIFSPASCTNGDTVFGILFFTLVFLFYMNVVGGERAFGKFLFSYAVSDIHNFSTDKATVLNTVFWTCFTSGRGVAILAARWISPRLLLCVEISANLACGIVLLAAGHQSSLLLWIFTGLFGFFLSPVFPAGLSWINQHVKMTGVAVGFVFTGSAIGGMVYQWLTGYLFEYYGTRSFMYVVFGYAVCISAVYVAMLLATRGRKNRFHESDEELQPTELSVPLNGEDSMGKT